jgi:hypothetical protein
MEFEELPPESVLSKILYVGRFIISEPLDRDAGAGVVDDSTKCLWTANGKRIEVSLVHGGGLIISQSKEVDPEYPHREFQRGGNF